MVTKISPGDILTVNDASNQIGIHHATLYRWAENGKVAFILLGGIMFIPATEVLRLSRDRKNNKQKM